MYIAVSMRRPILWQRLSFVTSRTVHSTLPSMSSLAAMETLVTPRLLMLKKMSWQLEMLYYTLLRIFCGM